MVPKGWSHTTFDKHVDVLTGFAFKSDCYSNAEDDIRLLRGDNIEPGNLRWRSAKYWSRSQLTGLDKYYLLEGDFVIALDRTWISSGLKVAEVTASDLPCLLVQRVARIRAKPTLEQSLLRQYFSGHRFEQFVKSVQTATAVPHISPNDIKEFAVCLPPLSEQKKIAKILSTWDQAISTTEQLLANSQQQKKALMQQLLTGKRRLLDKSGVRFSGEWQTVKLQSLVEIIYGKSPKDILDPEGEIPVYGTGGISGHSKEALCLNPAVLIGRKGTIDKPMFIDHPFWAIDTTFYCLQKNRTDLMWFYYLISNVELRKYSEASGVPSLSRETLYSIKVIAPSLLEEQQKIARVLSAADQEIATLQRKLDCLKQEKKALMQQLLTGKRRVKVGADEGMTQ